MQIAAVIPAYNEANRIGEVLSAVLASDAVSSVVVVDDGSTDLTASVAAEFAGVEVVRLHTNRGKGAAMMAGAEAASNATALLFLDADLRGLTTQHITSLTEPVDSLRAEMSMGIFTGGHFWTDLAQKIAPNITGQRCVMRSLFLKATHLSATRSGVEVGLNRYARAHAWRVALVPLEGMSHPPKEEKIGFLRGVFGRLKMYREIAAGMVTPLPGSRRGRLQRDRSPER